MLAMHDDFDSNAMQWNGKFRAPDARLEEFFSAGLDPT
jgi:hypothetical protein